MQPPSPRPPPQTCAGTPPRRERTTRRAACAHIVLPDAELVGCGLRLDVPARMRNALDVAGGDTRRAADPGVDAALERISAQSAALEAELDGLVWRVRGPLIQIPIRFL